MPVLLTFIPQNLGRGPDRKSINTHLSHVATKRRQSGKSEVRALVVAPTRIPKVQISRYGASAATPTRSEHNGTQSPSPSTTGPEVHDEDDRHIFAEPAPATVLDDGSLDPFASTLIPMTRSVQELLAFNLEMLQPWASGMEKGGDKSVSLANKFFWPKDPLSDYTIGYSLLAGLGNLASNITSSSYFSKVALEYSTWAYASLRERLVQNKGQPDDLLSQQIFSLFTLEVARHDYQAAAVHEHTLQRLLRATVRDGEATTLPNAHLLNAILWHEQQRLFMSLETLNFQFDSPSDEARHEQTLLRLQQNLTSAGHWPQRGVCGFWISSIDRDVKLGLKQVRQRWELLIATNQAQHMINEDFMTAFTHQSTLDLGRLVTLYNDANERLSDATAAQTRMVHRAAAASCLCAWYWFRCACHMEVPDGGNTVLNQMNQVYGHHPVILREVRKICEGALPSMDLVDQNDLHLWLWIFYAGTLAERAQANYYTNQNESTGDTFFDTSFTKLALFLRLTTWSQVEEVLSLFFYDATLSPLSAQHFERRMQAFLGYGKDQDTGLAST